MRSSSFSQRSIGVENPVLARVTIWSGTAALGAAASRRFPAAGGSVCKIRCHRLQEGRIHEWNPHFKRMRHAGPIGVAQQLVAQIEADLERRHFAPAVRGSGLRIARNVPTGSSRRDLRG